MIARCATQVLVDGKSQLRYLKEHGVIGPAAQVLGKGSICGVSLTRFAPSASLRKERRKTLKLEENEWAFMFLGRLNKDKGVIDLINAFVQLDQSKKTSSLFLVGHDESKSKRVLITFLLKFTLSLLKKNPKNYFKHATVFVYPVAEGFGLSVIEASALEKPIICSDAYGLADTIIQGETGLRHRVGDVEHLKEQLSFALNHPKELNAMGKAGRKYVEANFSEKRLLEEWRSFYKKQLSYKR